jgi:citrate synthase
MLFANQNNIPSEREQRAAEEFNALLSTARSAYDIPRSAFDGYRVKRGLREPDGTGVTAGVTRVGNAHGYVVSEGEKFSVEGVLEYRGYDIRDLISHFTAEGRFGFEECAYLLFFGHLPTREELAEFNDVLATLRRLPPRFTEDIIMKAPSPSIMNKMQSAVLSLYAYDPNPDEVTLANMLRQSMELVARLPVIAAQSYAVYRSAFYDKSLNIHNPRDELSTAENFLRVLRPDKAYTEEEAHLLDVSLVIHAEHGGGNCSTFATRVLSSSGTDTYSAVSAGIGALKGPRHGGANLKVQQMFDCIKENVSNPKDEEALTSFLYKILKGEANDGSGLIYGMGHAIYTKSDPRAVMLKKYARKLAYDKGYGDDFELLEAIERITPALFNAYKGTDRDMCANVDLYSGLVYRMLGIPVEMYTPLFTVARVTGWCAHRMEEYMTSNKIIRPGYKCIAKAQPYVALDDRH